MIHYSNNNYIFFEKLKKKERKKREERRREERRKEREREREREMLSSILYLKASFQCSLNFQRCLNTTSLGTSRTFP